MKFQHTLIDVPEADILSVQESVTDWRFGKRAVISKSALSLPMGCLLQLAAAPILIVILGIVASLVTNNWQNLFTACVGAIIIGGIIVAIVVIPFYRGGGERECVIDWENQTFTHKYRSKSQTFPISAIELLRIDVKRTAGDERESEAMLDLIIEGEPFRLFTTYQKKIPPHESAAALMRTGQRLADSLEVPLEVHGLNDSEKELAVSSTRPIKDVAQRYIKLAETVDGWRMLAEFRGRKYEEEYHRAEAVHHFMVAHELDPSLPEPLLRLGRLSEDPEIRSRAIAAAAESAPDSTAPKMERAKWLYDNDQVQESLALYSEIIDDEPIADAYHYRANVYEDLDRFQEAIDDLSQAIQLEPENELGYSKRARIFTLWYEETPRAELLDRALADYDQAIRIDPEASTFQTSRCEVLQKLGRTDEALLELNRLIAEHPADFWPVSVRGQLYLDQGHQVESFTDERFNSEQAIQDFTKVIQLIESEKPGEGSSGFEMYSTSLAFAYKFRAEALRRTGRRPEADRDEQRAEELFALDE